MSGHIQSYAPQLMELQLVARKLSVEIAHFDDLCRRLPPQVIDKINAIPGQDQISQEIPLRLSLLAEDLLKEASS